MADVFDTPPQEFKRKPNGWLVKRTHPHAAKIRELKEENAALQERLARVEAAMQTILSRDETEKEG